MFKPILILGRDGMGEGATEEDFACWTLYVCAWIDGVRLR